MIDLFLEFMSERFLDGVNYAIQAGWIVLAILVIRILPIRLPRWSICLLWGLVALRLALPFQIEFAWSLQPSAEPVPQNIAVERVPEIDSGVEVIDRVVNPVVTQSFAPDPATSANPLQIFIPLASVAWLLGIVVMLLYALISTLRLGHRVKASVREGKYYLCDDIQMPFVFGLIRPKIYLPSGISVNTLPHVLAHEERHIKRLDHLWKPLGFLILSIYWFHPLLWVGYILFCRDLEKACDEAVVGKLDLRDRKAYSEALLSVSMGRFRVMVYPLAFGEEGVKGRIKSVLHYKKPGFWIVLVAILLVILLAVGFLTSPGKKEDAKSVDSSSADGITLHLISCEERDGIPSILVEWENESDDILEYGTMFTVYKDGKLHEPREEVAWLMPLFMVERGGSQTEIISFWAWDMTEPGKYRVEKKYNLASDPDTSYTASASFAITEENGETFWQVEEKEVESQPLPPDGEPMHKEDLEELLEYGVEDCQTILEELKDKKADCETRGDSKGAEAAALEIRETEEKLTLYQSLESRYAAGENADTLWQEYLKWQIGKTHPGTNETETEKDMETESETIAIDLTVSGRSEGLSGEELEKEMVALMHDRSEAVKAAELAGWYNPLTDRITVTYSDGSFDITDETTLEKIASLLAVENLRACVSSPEYERAFGEEGYGEILFDAMDAYSSFNGGKTMLLDFHNGTYLSVIWSKGVIDDRDSTEIHIGTFGSYEDDTAVVSNEGTNELPFIYYPGCYVTNIAIEELLNEMIELNKSALE